MNYTGEWAPTSEEVRAARERLIGLIRERDGRGRGVGYLAIQNKLDNGSRKKASFYGMVAELVSEGILIERPPMGKGSHGRRWSVAP